jgi:hypothetical protein
MTCLTSPVLLLLETFFSRVLFFLVHGFRNLRFCRLHHVTTGRKSSDSVILILLSKALYISRKKVANPINGTKLKKNQIILFLPSAQRIIISSACSYGICIFVWPLAFRKEWEFLRGWDGRDAEFGRDGCNVLVWHCGPCGWGVGLIVEI